MLPLETLGRVTTVDGKELVLYHRDGVFHIRIDGLELMSSRAHGSEQMLARLACGLLEGIAGPRMLVGGLGLGYTLRAALDCLGADAEVVVAELFPAVVEWNRGPLAHLARHPLKDPRVTVEETDVRALLGRRSAAFDAILLDVDNGPAALTLTSNQWLYTAPGLAAIRRSLKGAGILAIWSPTRDAAFVRRLRRAGFEVRSETVSARGHATGPRHTIFLASRPASGKAG
ncbi:MAG: hypothetical protein GY856_25030 [bacterium]|nr:hypothetical protein [bacterium]